MRQKKRRVNRLKDLTFEELHLLSRRKSPANRRSVLLIKETGGKTMADEERTGVEVNDTEVEPIELEGLDLEELEETVEEAEGGSKNAIEKALDIIKDLVSGKEPVEKAAADVKAAKMALKILAAHNKPGAPDWLRQAVAALAKGCGYGKPEYYGKPEVKKEDEAVKALLKVAKKDWEKLSGSMQKAVTKLAASIGYEKYEAVEKADAAAAVKTFLKTACSQENWSGLSPAVQDAVDKLAQAVGYEKYQAPEGKPKYEGYPEVKKAVDEATVELKAQLTKAQTDLAAMQQKARKAELVPISKSTGMEVDDLYKLEQLDPELYATLTKHCEALENRAKEAGIFLEKGTEAPAAETSVAGQIDAKVRELIEKGQAKDYADALSIASAMPEFARKISELWINMPNTPGD